MSVCCEVSGAKMAAPAAQASQDKKDLDYLEKLIKFFALKSAQIIVQARLGGKVQTDCNPDSTQTDWFNLAIKDLPEVLAEAKKAMSIAGSRLPLCVEISLRTNDQETMTLETWCIGIRTDLIDPTMRVTYPLYTRMGILLKSLVTLTRVTPAYKLSRNKSDYVMCYRIYVGEPQLYGLGSGYTQMNVGQVGTSLGTLQMSVAYRTKLTISPQHNKSCGIMVKSDHFRPDAMPADNNTNNCGDLKTSVGEHPVVVKIGAFADNRKTVIPEPEPIDIPFRNLLSTPQQSPPNMPSPPTTTTLTSLKNADNTHKNADNITLKNTDINSVKNADNNSLKNADSENGNVTPRCGSIGSHNEEPFILVDLKTPFASSNANTDLGLFYRECQSAPPLQTFSEEPVPVVEQIGDLTKQLEEFETSLQEYDNIISSFCHGENNN